MKIDLKLETKETYTVCGKLYGKGEPGKLLITSKVLLGTNESLSKLFRFSLMSRILLFLAD